MDFLRWTPLRDRPNGAIAGHARPDRATGRGNAARGDVLCEDVGELTLNIRPKDARILWMR